MALTKPDASGATTPPLEPLHLFRVEEGWAVGVRPSDISTRSESSRPMRKSSKRPHDTQKRSSKRKGKLTAPLEYCASILQELLLNRYAWPFIRSVDAERVGLRNHHNIIEHPMDMGTVKQKMDNREYDSPEEFAEDMRLIFANCYRNYPPDSDLVAMANEVKSIFELQYAQKPEKQKSKKQKPSPQPVEAETDSDSSRTSESFSSGSPSRDSEDEEQELQRKLQELREQLSVVTQKVDLLAEECRKKNTKKKGKHQAQKQGRPYDGCG